MKQVREFRSKSALPEVKTSLPGPKTKLILEKYNKFFNTIMQPPMVTKKAYGCIIEDIDGNMFLNFMEDICIAGYSLPEIINATIDQTKNMITRGLGALPFLECAELLLSNLPGELSRGRVNYCVSGTETVELAILLAKTYTKRSVILSYLGSHHGLIGNPNQLSGDFKIKKNWRAKIEDNIHIPYPTCYRCLFKQQYPDCDLGCLEYLENILETVVSPDQVAGLLIEPIQIHSGVFVPPDEYIKNILDICRKNGIQLIVDEVFTGFGKTGKFLASDHWKIVPDILCLGKAMGGGFPLSAVITKREVTDSTRMGDELQLTRVTGSFAGNSVSCAVSIENMNYVKKYRLAENAQIMGDYIMKLFNDVSERKNSLGDVRGKGLLIGVDLVKCKKTRQPAFEYASNIVQEAFKNGLIIGAGGRYGNVLGLHPPLILNLEQADIAFDILNRLIN